MRSCLLALLFAAMTVAAHAEPTTNQGCNLVGQDLSRLSTAFVAPQGCCTGRMQCAQFLSTTTVVRPQRDQRT